ncbi:MAG: CRISPR system precrRNA processing endoribonuclease RAMP protein Cas6 [Saccharofermentanales bacterium]
MLRQIKLTFRMINKNCPNVFWAYNFYSALLHKLNKEFVDALHDTGLKPVSQYLSFPQGCDVFHWIVNIIGEEANACILPFFCENSEFYIENHSVTMRAEKAETVMSFSQKEFTSKYLADDPVKRFLNITTMTPASFKSNDNYMIFPSAEHVIKSAIQKWNAYSTEVIIDDPEAVEQMIQNTIITSYKLKSFQYHLKGIQIPSFFGEFTLKVSGPEPLVRLVNLLVNYTEFSGIGIKCALGMGGVKIKSGG